MDALRALEAARSARARVNELVMLLTERALGTGASMASLGYRFTDPPT